MTAAIAGAIRGRPSASSLAERLEATRRRNADLVAELIAERYENGVFASRVAAAAVRMSNLAVANQPLAVMGMATELGYHASRRLRQIGPVTP